MWTSRRVSGRELGLAGTVVLTAALLAFACTTKPGSPPSPAAAPAAAPSAEFDQKWSTLAQKDVDVFYVEDDRGEGLMGNVRRARHNQSPEPSVLKPADPNLLPVAPSPEDVQLVIKQNLPGVKACFLRISREGEQRSGKAIVSFEIGAGGEVTSTKVDAPAFAGTSLPGCVSGMVSHWAFPKSQNGGLAISYPFVFVGG
jgi:hypothetical protein